MSHRQFDIVYTSVGVLTWLADLESRARAIRDLRTPGGLFYLRQGHPMMSSLAFGRTDDLLVVDEAYFATGSPVCHDVGATYASDTVLTGPTTTYQWQHPLAEIFGAVLGAGSLCSHSTSTPGSRGRPSPHSSRPRRATYCLTDENGFR